MRQSHTVYSLPQGVFAAADLLRALMEIIPKGIANQRIEPGISR
jgi:hypothetical protein